MRRVSGGGPATLDPWPPERCTSVCSPGRLFEDNPNVLRFDTQTAAITSWKANGIGQELVNSGDTTGRGLNDCLYILGGDDRKVQGASDAKMTVVDAGLLLASIRVDWAARLPDRDGLRLRPQTYSQQAAGNVPATVQRVRQSAGQDGRLERRKKPAAGKNRPVGQRRQANRAFAVAGFIGDYDAASSAVTGCRKAPAPRAGKNNP